MLRAHLIVTKLKTMNTRLYQLKIELYDSTPSIWRRFTVPADIRLDRLHRVIQIVMGWENCHLYQFTIKRTRYWEELEDGKTGLPCRYYHLSDLLLRKGGTIRYLYDFGDKWQHRLIIENANYPQADNAPRLICLDGERACPPEDIGGIQGFNEFQAALRDPKHPLHAEYTDWLGDDYRADAFDLSAINRQLAAYDRQIP